MKLSFFFFHQSKSSLVWPVPRPCPDPSENMLIVTCPSTAVLIPAILKHKDENRYEAQNRTKIIQINYQSAHRGEKNLSV